MSPQHDPSPTPLPWRVGSVPLDATTGEDPAPVDGRDDDGYADLRTYATIGDGRTVALVARDGDIDWLPLPDLDSVPVFAALLDAQEGGRLGLAPEEPFLTSRRYLPGTNVLETTYTTDSGTVRVTDSLNTGLAGRLPWCELARRIDGVTGSVRLRGTVAPGTRLRTASPWISDTQHGTVLRVDGLTLAVRTLNETDVDITRRDITADFVTSPGSRHLIGVVSTNDEPLFLPDPADVDAGVDRTVEAWQRWATMLTYRGPFSDQVARSALVLKQLIHAPTGAIAAAGTTSLPESATTSKNWDYRYSWIRDTAFSLTALFQLGVREETHASITWLLRILREQTDRLGVLHALDGSAPGSEVTSYDVPGWRGSQPVVTGNRATDQLQLGVYGDLFSTVQVYVDNGNVLDAPTGRLLTTVADRAADDWRRPDAGMWELEEDRHYTTSKLGCWQALTHAAHLAEVGQIDGDVERWRHEADAIRAWVEEHAWSETLGAYEFYPGSGELDASILLHAISGFERGDRMRRTLDALAEELGEGPHLHRYTGMAQEEETFVACSFWMVAARALCGQLAEAEALMEQLVREVPNDVGVMAEMLDPATGAHVGNLPQALSHLALVNAALTIDSVRRGDVGPVT
ncbi:glycoside hydrolase family 15 protein [Serinibacter arcticus]|uniref:Glucoamylase n=1 Tax=Serinibacter arcticus TaxID=1655435 RepID=A0A4Z1E7F6_9MICO|nr:glycoside hydrolase family 15 protein [Serinibacter arcticus]TGO05511.1 Glucoamylase [Serinibacter arcticus]